MIVIDVNQMNSCIEYEAELFWISPKLWIQCPCTDKGYKVVDSGFNKIPSKPLENVFRSQDIFFWSAYTLKEYIQVFFENHSFVWHSTSFKVFMSKLFVEFPELGE